MKKKKKKKVNDLRGCEALKRKREVGGRGIIRRKGEEGS